MKATALEGYKRSPNGLLRDMLFALVECERDRQEGFVDSGRFSWSCATPGIDPAKKLMVLCEELGEVARAVREQEFGLQREHHDLKTELVQVAAVAVAWLEAIVLEESEGHEP